MRAEFVIYGNRGKGLPVPLGSDKTANLFCEPRSTQPGVHSRKPDCLADDLARQYPGVARLETFARKARVGWDMHGNETCNPVC
jgi:N6-adenosine-specific RNA methylase IME4